MKKNIKECKKQFFKFLSLSNNLCSSIITNEFIDSLPEDKIPEFKNRLENYNYRYARSGFFTINEPKEIFGIIALLFMFLFSFAYLIQLSKLLPLNETTISLGASTLPTILLLIYLIHLSRRALFTRKLIKPFRAWQKENK